MKQEEKTMPTPELIKAISEMKAAAKAAKGTFRDSSEYKDFYTNLEAMDALASAVGQGRETIDISLLAPAVQQQLKAQNPDVQTLPLTQEAVEDLMDKSYDALKASAENYVHYKMMDHSLKPQSGDVKALNEDDLKKLAVMVKVLGKKNVRNIMEQHDRQRNEKAEQAQTEADRLELPQNLETNGKQLTQSFYELSNYSGMEKAFSKLAGLKDDELAGKLKTELVGVTDAAQKNRVTQFLLTGVQATRLLEKYRQKGQLVPEEANRLKQTFARLNKLSGTTLRDDIAEAMNQVEPDTAQIMTDAARACGILAAIMPDKLRHDAWKSAMADQKMFSDIQDRFETARGDVTDAVGFLNLNSKSIIAEYKDSCKAVQYSLGALRQKTNGGKTAAEYKEMKDRARELRHRQAGLEANIIIVKDILDGSTKNPYAEMADFKKNIADLNNPSSPFRVNEETEALQGECARLAEQAKKEKEERTELRTRLKELKQKGKTLDAELSQLKKETGEKNERVDELEKERNVLREEIYRLENKADDIESQEAEHNQQIAQLQVEIDEKNREQMKQVNEYLQKYFINRVKHLPTREETQKLLNRLQKKIQVNINEKQKEPGFVERMYTEPGKYLQETRQELKKLREAKVEQPLYTRDEKEVADAGKGLRQKNAERKNFEKVAESYNTMCKLSVDKKLAFRKAADSAKDARAYQTDGEQALMTQLKGIAKHMEDKRRLFHTDSAEYSALKKALNDIVTEKDFDKLIADPKTYAQAFEPQLTEEKLRKLQKAANDYLTAKNSDPSRYPSSMRLSRLGYAQELADICSIYTELTTKNRTDEATTDRFLETNRFEDKRNELEPYDPEHKLENSIRAANASFDKQLKADGIEELLHIAKQAADAQPEKQEEIKAPSIGGR